MRGDDHRSTLDSARCALKAAAAMTARNSMIEAMMKNDPTYSNFFSYRTFFEDFLRYIYRDEGDLEDKFDLSTLRQATAEHVTPEFRKRCSDTVWVCDLASSGVTVCFCVEFQTNCDFHMPVRMAGYNAMLLGSLTKEAKTEVLRRACPPVALVVIFHGPGRWNVTRDVRDTFAETGIKAIQSRLVSAPYELIDEREKAAGSLDTRLLYPALLRMIYSEDILQVVDAWRAVRRRLVGQGHSELRKQFVKLIQNVVSPKFKGIEIMDEDDSMSTIEERFAESFDKGLLKFKRESKEEGLQEGMEKGKKEAMRSVLQNLLENKFGMVPEAARRRINSADCGQLQRWSVRVIQAAEIDQVFTD